MRSRLPRARLLSNEPTLAQVRWVTRAAWFALALFLILTLIGNHVPPS